VCAQAGELLENHLKVGKGVATMTAAQPPAKQKIQEALRARDALAAALTAAGVQLPAMDVRTPWLGGLEEDGQGGRRARYALVQLGVCSAPVAHALAEVIARGAAR
jgi:hypothetical protein